MACSAGCGPAGRAQEQRPDVTVDVVLDPEVPVAGRAIRAVVSVRDADGVAVHGARLQLEALMSHPGMAPVVAALSENNGIYSAPVEFTMAGDWVVMTSGTLADGRRVKHTQRLDVKEGQ
jgi:hypothetical protein